MKLNIGSSNPEKYFVKPEWVNIDISKSFIGSKNFIVADGCKLPFRDNAFEELRAIHVLEHIDRNQHINFYKETYRTIKPGCSIFIEVPDFLAVCRQIDKLSNYNLKDIEVQERLRCWTLSIYGKGRWAGDAHRHGFYREQLQSDLEQVGFKVNFPEKMISNHYYCEPVILVRGVK